ncbi:MAG: sucrase ferredoxin [Actinomycetota bacterium]|nr:sucrase ferredoxin [Actinomycetota bacterium]
MIERGGCARAALLRGEPMLGTASLVRRWIMLEQPGPWGRDAVNESRLPRRVAAELQLRASRVSARVVLIRRYGRSYHEERQCFVGCTTTSRSWIEEFKLTTAAELLDLDLGPLQDSERVGGRPVLAPLYLICTNGRHDVCCAEFGRPLARVLARTRPEQTWECSHIGGDRFAANLLCFPHGLYFGRVGPQEGLGVVDAYERGLIDLGHYRGRAGQPFHVQAAEYFVRREAHILGIEALTVQGQEALGDRRTRVTFAGPEGVLFTAEIVVRRVEEGQLLTCRAERPLHPPRYELVGVETDRRQLPESPAS